MTFTHFLLVAALSYRLQRIITTDSWPPSRWFRVSIAKRANAVKTEGIWADVYDFFTCPWCIGTWLTAAIFCIDYYHPIPSLLLYIAAAATLVGQLGQRDE